MSGPKTRVRFGGLQTSRGFLFELTGGDVALDLANTLVARRTENPDELLGAYSDLVEWSRQSGLIDERRGRTLIREAAVHPLAAARVLRRAIEIRELIFRTFSKTEPAQADLRALEELMRQAAGHRHLANEAESVVWRWDDEGLDSMLWPVIDAASVLLTSDLRARVRTCEGHTCLWLFIDRSRQKNRRWCDMTVCGNRAKARRHYEKLAGREPRT